MKPVPRLSASLTRENYRRSRDDLGRSVLGARAEVQFADNASNPALYEYRRTTLMFRVRRDFR